ncbi:4-phytase/acid phosphatase [Luteibacter jiangsuensis]|uniref:4-phytase/acid phosphatase n=1 Tax=Luteibacter jiangsuensis TaxID=637577 RepID=A0ABT9SVP2_9GAMM|nr:histidine-type phosphatase [Luteibacter jiangsuensis]MDQ0008047.1 4-phytase/acid phosphatase [Luteibacter jiangsuensis]
MASTVATASGDGARLEIVLMRHGVRSPTKPAATYADYANTAWPEWPVGPGRLTAHGREGMQAIGEQLHRQLIADGALGKGCPTSSSLVVVGDSTPRNRDSSAALLSGLAPGCDIGYLATEGDTNNPLFHFRKDDADDDGTAMSMQPPAALADLQSLLLDCAGSSCAEAAKRAGKRLLPVDTGKAMKLAGTLSENLMLAYVEGMPAHDVAFGRGDVALLGRLIALHNAQFEATKKAMPAAARAGSNLVAHIAATFDAALGKKPAVEPLMTSKAGVVLLVGHDTNLANVAGVLGLDWHDPTRPDDYPPGGAIVLSLVSHEGHDTIRIRSLMPDMDQLRTNHFGTMESLRVHVAGCRLVGECTVEEFRAIVERGVDTTRVDTALPSMIQTGRALPRRL